MERDGVPLQGRVTQKRRLAVLAYLAVAGSRPVNRDRLLALLWPERGEEQARHSLSQILYELRLTLSPHAIGSGIDELRLDPTLVSSDIGDFEKALADRRWEAAAALHRGPFLDGFNLDDAPEFERWSEQERRAVARGHAEALEALAAEAAGRGERAKAADFWRRRAALDPLDARVALQLMRANVAAGDPSAALRHARVHAELLRAELEVGPDPAVTAFAARLRQAPNPVLPHAVPEASSPQATEAPTEPRAPAIGPAAGTRRRPRSLIGRRLGLAVGPLVVLGLWALLPPASVPAEVPQVVLLGEIVGPDTVLALAVREALEAELSGEPGIRVVPTSQVREHRRLMGLGLDSTLPPHLMDELAQRHGARVVVRGSVTPLGTGAQLLIQLVEPRDGALLLGITERPQQSEQVIPAVARLGRKVRRELGAIPADTTVQPLPMVATTSLAALRYYALARRQAGLGARSDAARYGEAALLEDSLFAMAHYVVGDMLWFLDSERHSTAHLQRAFELSKRATLREQLIIRARYEQLVRDRPDSSLAVWQLLLAAHPEEPLAFEGMTWALRALGRFRDAANAANSLMRVAPEMATPSMRAFLASTPLSQSNVWSPKPGSWPADEARYAKALKERDYRGVLDAAEKTTTAIGRSYRRQIGYLALGLVDSAAGELAKMRRMGRPQMIAGGFILQATANAADSSRHRAARELAQEAFDWVDEADVSPPAHARLSERISLPAAWTGDVAMLHALRSLLESRDAQRGGGLRSYRIALGTVAGALAFAHKAYGAAARLLYQTRSEFFFGRSTATVALLEADALRMAGDAGGARSLYRWILENGAPEGDADARSLLVELAASRLAALGPEGSAHRP